MKRSELVVGQHYLQQSLKDWKTYGAYTVTVIDDAPWEQTTYSRVRKPFTAADGTMYRVDGLRGYGRGVLVLTTYGNATIVGLNTIRATEEDGKRQVAEAKAKRDADFAALMSARNEQANREMMLADRITAVTGKPARAGTARGAQYVIGRDVLESLLAIAEAKQ